MKLKFWKSNKSKHDCKEHCGHAQIVENMVHEHSVVDTGRNLEPIHDCNKTCDHLSGYDNSSWEHTINLLYGTVKCQNDIDFYKFLKEILKIKKYQLLAKKYNLEFEFGEDI